MPFFAMSKSLIASANRRFVLSDAPSCRPRGERGGNGDLVVHVMVKAERFIDVGSGHLTRCGIPRMIRCRTRDRVATCKQAVMIGKGTLIVRQNASAFGGDHMREGNTGVDLLHRWPR